MRPTSTALLERVAYRFMVHTYTRTAIVEGAETGYGADETPLPPVSDLPCFYSPITRARGEDGAWVVVQAPSLMVPTDDVTERGDVVVDILDRSGSVVLPGPLVVTDTQVGVSNGSTIVRVLVLAGGELG